jgi:chemotaxis protein MotB
MMEFKDIKETTAYKAGDDMAGFYDEILSYPSEKETNRWSVSWSDLMMTMFIFFAVMYAFQAGNKELFFGHGPGKNKISESGSNNVLNIGLESNPSTVYDQTRQAMADIMMDGLDSPELMKDGAMRIVLAGDLLFDPGSVDLKIGARYQLDQIARVLNENEFMINVVGHTDDAPTRSDLYPTNWELSSKRAVMVARYLTEVTKVDEKRIFVSAHSSLQPVKNNDTGANRALNRRVELVLMKTKPNEQPLP